MKRHLRPVVPHWPTGPSPNTQLFLMFRSAIDGVAGFLERVPAQLSGCPMVLALR